ncbi:MAG: RNase adapter RapZ, partial [Armatimonadota bacterium]
RVQEHHHQTGPKRLHHRHNLLRTTTSGIADEAKRTRCGRAEEIVPVVESLRPGLVVVFLDAGDDELVRRFKETRRSHPLFRAEGGILQAISREREVLRDLRAAADWLVDTSVLEPSELRSRIRARFGGSGDSAPAISVTVASFGFKYGVPLDADLVFDVRFLRNPYYDGVLRERDGLDPAVRAHVDGDPRTDCLLDQLTNLITWGLPHYVAEGKAYLTVAIGCTGGRHRSVVVAERIAEVVREAGYAVIVEHRDRERRR